MSTLLIPTAEAAPAETGTSFSAATTNSASLASLEKMESTRNNNNNNNGDGDDDRESASREQAATTSCTRCFSDLDVTSFAMYAGILCAARTAVQQPLNLALVRKQFDPIAANMSTRQVMYRIWAYETRAVTGAGLIGTGMLQGMLALVLANGLSEAIYLSAYEYCREFLPIKSDVSREASSGYVGDALCRMLHVPLLCCANRQMTRFAFHPTDPTLSLAKHEYRGMGATFRQMYSEKGVRSLYAGLGTTLTMGCMWTGAWWASYDQIKSLLYTGLSPYLVSGDAIDDVTLAASNSVMLSKLPKWVWSREDNLAINSSASLIASACTAALFNPVLVIRTRLQATPNANFMGVVKGIYRQGGIPAFWVGTWLNVTASALDGYLASTSYELAKLWSDTTRN